MFLFYPSVAELVLIKVFMQNEGYITLKDVKASKLSGHVFNILFNLNKFITFETRDPFIIRQVKANFYNLIHCSCEPFLGIVSF